MADTLIPNDVLALTSAFQTVYTVPAVTKAVITFIRLANTTNAAVTVRLCIVPNAGSASISNAIMWDFSIPANDFIDTGKGMVLSAQSFVRALCSVDNAITIKLDVIESA